MKKNDSVTNLFAIFGVIGSVIILFLIMPFISFWLAYFGGWIASVVIGGPLCQALNTLFNTTRFTPEMLPWCAGALGWIGGYFKNITNYNKNKD